MYLLISIVLLFSGPIFADTLDSNTGLTTYHMANGRVVVSGPEIIIRLNTPSALTKLRKQWHPLAIEALSPKLYLLTFAPGSDIPALCRQITDDPAVSYAHPNQHSKRHRR